MINIHNFFKCKIVSWVCCFESILHLVCFLSFMGLTTFTAKIWDTFYAIFKKAPIAPTGSTTIKQPKVTAHILVYKHWHRTTISWLYGFNTVKLQSIKHESFLYHSATFVYNLYDLFWSLILFNDFPSAAQVI
jgi:hypothetical protein